MAATTLRPVAASVLEGDHIESGQPAPRDIAKTVATDGGSHVTRPQASGNLARDADPARGALIRGDHRWPEVDRHTHPARHVRAPIRRACRP